MAENINIKVLIDAADAAKTVQETRKALKDLRSAALQVEEGSEAFNSITTAAGQLQDKMGDLAATTKYLGDDMKNLKGLTSIATGIAGGFAAAQSAAALFGGENQMVEESLIKVQSAMGILQGIQAVGEVLQKESAATLFLQNTYRSLKVALLGEEAVATVATTAATEAEAIATAEAAVAQEGLNTAMKMNPILGLIGLITAAAAALYAFSKDTKNAEEEVSALDKSIQGMRASFELEEKSFAAAIEQLKEYKTGSKERATAIENINKQYGTNLQNLKDESKFLAQVNTEVARYSELAKARLMIKINESKAEDALTKAEAKRDELRRANKTVETIRKESAEMEKSYQIMSKMTAQQISVLRFSTQSGMDMQNAFIDIKANIPLAIKQYENYADALLKVNSKYVGKVDLAQKDSGKETVKNEKDKNDKVIKEKEKFVADYTNLDEEILKNNIEITDQIEANWATTLQDQTENVNSNFAQQKEAMKKEYEDAIADIKKQFEDWRKSPEVANDIKIGKWDVNTQWTEFYKANAGFEQRQITLKSQLNRKLELLDVEHQKNIEKLTKEHAERVKSALLEANREVLASPEYKRYLEYITTENEQAQAKIAESNAKSIERYNADLAAKVKIYQKHQATIVNIAEENNLKLEKDAEGNLTIFDAFKNNLGEDMSSEVVGAYEDAQEQSQQFREELKAMAQQYVNVGTTVTEQLGKITSASGKASKLYKDGLKSTDLVSEKISSTQKKLIEDLVKKFPDLTDEAVKFMNEMGAGTSEADQKMVKYITTLKKLNMIDPVESMALGNFSKALDEVNGKLDITTELQRQVGKAGMKQTTSGAGSMIEATMENVQSIEEVFTKVFDLRREIKQGEAGENKLLIGVYRDKLKILQSGETELATALEKANKDAKAKREAEIASQEIIVKNAKYIYELKKAAFTPTTSAAEMEQAGQPLADAQAKLDKLKGELKNIEGFKGFKIFPTKEEAAAGIISLEQAINQYDGISEIITKKTKDRYDELVKVSNEFYEKEKFALFMKLNKGEITQDEYDKKSEEMKINHEENMISIDVAYGKKGQDALTEIEKKKTALAKTEEEKRKDQKEKILQEALELETQLMQGAMDLYAAYTDWKVQKIQLEADARMRQIDDEQAMWENSLKERTVQEIQEEQKRTDFRKRKEEEQKIADAQIREAKMRQFRAQKAMDIVQAGINGALAITKVFAETGLLGTVLQGLVIAQTAAQIGFIAAQQPAFAEGGLVTGPGGPKDDKITARLSNGESVINAKSTKQFAPILSAINQAGGGKPIPSTAGGAMANGGGGMTTTYIGEKSMAVDNRDVVDAINRLNQRPIETYVKESSITSAQSQARKEDRRSSY